MIVLLKIMTMRMIKCQDLVQGFSYVNLIFITPSKVGSVFDATLGIKKPRNKQVESLLLDKMASYGRAEFQLLRLFPNLVY